MEEMFGDENGDPVPEVAETPEAEEINDGEKGES